MTAMTLEEVKRHLRITHNDDNALLADQLSAAEDHVAAYIGGPLIIDGTVPAGIKAAIAAWVQFLYDGADPDLGGLLAPYRRWAF